MALWCRREREIHGFRVSVVALRSRIAEHMFSRVAAAIDVIASVDKRILARIRKDMPRILIGYASAGEAGFDPQHRICVLAREMVQDSSINPLQIAFLIVHEGAHARIHNAGIPYLGELRGRIERSCVKCEMSFAAKLEDPRERDWYLNHFAARLESDAWDFSDSQLLAREERRLRDARVPEWAIRLRLAQAHFQLKWSAQHRDDKA